jgi:enoyl-CoA hydratase/carnithine racemase
MRYRTVRYSKKGHLARITLGRPVGGHAFIWQMSRELGEISGRIEADDRIYVVIITGTGDAFLEFSEGERGEIPPVGPAAVIAGIDRPVIAAINGDAIGEGLEIALSCDIRLASAKARFGLPQVARGRIPVDGGTQRLSRVVGRGKALELLLTADIITAAEALEIGLVSKVVPPGALEAETEELAGTIAARGPVALRYLKEAVHKGLDMTLEQGLRLEADLYFLLHTTADRTEGVTAFRKKRPPRFRGR